MVGESIKLIRVVTVPYAFKTLLRGQMRFMSEKGMNVTMVSSADEDMDAIVRHEGCPHHQVEMIRNFSPLADLVALLRMIKFFVGERPHIVHANTVKAGLLSMVAAYVARVPVRIYSVGGIKFTSPRYEGLAEQFLVFIERLIYAAATHVWPNSRSLHSFILERRLTKPSKIEFIGQGSTNGIDLSTFSPCGLDEERLKAHKQVIQYDEQNTYLLFVGRLVGDKGIDEFVQVFQDLKDWYPTLRTILVGPLEFHDDPLEAETIRAIQEDDHIIHVPWSDDVKYFMTLADYFVFPSHREGFPNVLLEAGAMRCPVICSDIIGNVDVVDHMETGVLFRVGDARDMYDKLNQVLSGKINVDQLAEALYHKVHREYGREQVNEAIYRNYIRVLAETR